MSHEPTREQAVERVKKAVLYFKEHGQKQAIVEFNNPGSPFNQGGMYMFGQLFDEGITQPIHPNMRTRGKKMGDLVDADGRFLIRELNRICEQKGSGWFEYKWRNPQTGNLDMKSSYVEKVGDMCIGTGIHTPGIK